MSWNDKDKRDMALIIIGALIGFFLVVSAAFLYNVVVGNDEQLPALNPYENDRGGAIENASSTEATFSSDSKPNDMAEVLVEGNESPMPPKTPNPPRIVLR